MAIGFIARYYTPVMCTNRAERLFCDWVQAKNK